MEIVIIAREVVEHKEFMKFKGWNAALWEWAKDPLPAQATAMFEAS